MLLLSLQLSYLTFLLVSANMGACFSFWAKADDKEDDVYPVMDTVRDSLSV
jgi:hypothetical protein